MTVESSILEQLSSTGFVVYKVQGKSMEPMLVPDRDVVVITQFPDSKLQENDVVLYNKNGKLKLHRLVQIKDNGELVFLGDNCAEKEYDILPDNVLGIMTSFVHNGKRYKTDDELYLTYVQTLRAQEKTRIKKKRIIDSVSWHLNFLPPKLLASVKKRMRRMLNYKMSFPE